MSINYTLFTQFKWSLQESMSQRQKELFSRILKTNSKGKFSPELRSFALTLQFYSAKAYDYVREVFNSVLPHPSTLRRWYKHIDGTPGFTAEAFKVLGVTVAENHKNNKKTYGCLMVDEIAIRRHLHWDGTRMYGYIDYGTEMEESDSLPEATEAMVFLLNAANGHWKIPVGYFLIRGLSGSERANLVRQCLKMINKVGVIVISLTFDGAASNIAMANQLGACIKADVSSLKASFVNSDSEVPVSVFLDACHMLKLIRNAFGVYKIFYHNAEAIKWEFLERLVVYTEKNELHAANKLRRRHLNWQNEKMNVRLAAQTFSNSVADALNWLEFDLKEPQFQGSAATATFCRNVNGIFDLLNSRNQFVKDPSKAPISAKNIYSIKNKIEVYTKYICSLDVIVDLKTGLQPVTSSGRRTGFIGMILSMAAALNVYEKVIQKDDSGMNYLLTYKLSQDHLETFFSAIRRQGGFNNNPSAYQLQTAYKRLLVHHEITGSQYANCIAMDSTQILHLGSSAICAGGTAELTTDIIESNLAQDINTVTDHDYTEDPRYCKSIYINDIVAYIAGFAIRKVKKLVHCAACSAVLATNRPDEITSLLLERKNRGKLTRAVADVVDLCQVVEQVFRGPTAPRKNSNRNVIYNLIIATLRRMPENILSSLNDHTKEQEPLNDHKYQLIKLILSTYFKIRIHHHTISSLEETQRIRKLRTKEVLFRHQ